MSIDGVADSEVDRVIRAGLAEDLADGPDVTSLATILPITAPNSIW